MPRGQYDRGPGNAAKRWTQEEEAYLQEAWGSRSLKSIAGRLGRSENAVVVRIQRLGLGPGLQAGERISWNQFVIALTGSSSGTYLKKRLIAAGFPVHTQIIRGRNKARYTMVDIDEFWEFAEKNKNLFDFARMEPYAFGREPEWAKRKRRLDAERLRKGHAHNDPWTPAEDKKLRRLLKKHCYTYSELAKEIRRSETAIKRRIITLGIRERPVRRPSRPWTEAEERKLIRMRDEGYGWDNIAAALDRTALCVRGKYERIGYTQDNETRVAVPDKMLENGDTTQDYDIYAFVYAADKDAGETTYKMRLHVRSRPKPKDYTAEDEGAEMIFSEVVAIVSRSVETVEQLIAQAKEEIGKDYILPIATQTRLGGVRIGNGVNVEDNGRISVDALEVLSDAVASESDTEEMLNDVFGSPAGGDISGETGKDYVLPTATQTRLGGVRIGNGVNVEDNGRISVDAPEVLAGAVASESDTAEMLDDIFNDAGNTIPE